MKKSRKRLTLRAETVRNLQADQLGEAVGGLGPIIIPRTQYTCEIIRCIPNTNWSVCELCVVR
ncbi:MAG: class I lanthipeptide [Kofleriaceae bacterium]